MNTSDIDATASRLAGAISDMTFDRCGGWEYDASKVADLIAAELRKAAGLPVHPPVKTHYFTGDGAKFTACHRQRNKVPGVVTDRWSEVTCPACLETKPQTLTVDSVTELGAALADAADQRLKVEDRATALADDDLSDLLARTVAPFYTRHLVHDAVDELHQTLFTLLRGRVTRGRA